jgi:hypothetical protein
MPASPDIVLSEETKVRVDAVFKTYWASPFCAGTIELGEVLLAWALRADLTQTKQYADAIQTESGIAYQIKTGLRTSPVTFARVTTPSQEQLVNSPDWEHINTLGHELLEWMRQRITQPYQWPHIKEVRVARVLYTKRGEFTYYERAVASQTDVPDLQSWRWSEAGNALEGYLGNVKWLSWYPQGRQNTRNQNQLHFHGENELIPPPGASNRIDFSMGSPARISFDEIITLLKPLVERGMS